MELERKRGISISSTVLQFEYQGFAINLLDTPGHKDFSEDTYRVLTAVDGVVMVIDAAKGIESQTQKLFEICRRRGIPIFTFINKCDRPTQDPLELLDELERVLGIGSFPVNWPIGTGVDFKGSSTASTRKSISMSAPPVWLYRAPESVGDVEAAIIREQLSPEMHAKLTEEIDMLNMAGEDFDIDSVYSGQMTPVFFGSAMNNFGVELLLKGFSNALHHLRPGTVRRSPSRPITRPSPPSSSRSRPAWIPSTATASPLPASAQASLSAT